MRTIEELWHDVQARRAARSAGSDNCRNEAAVEEVHVIAASVQATSVGLEQGDVQSEKKQKRCKTEVSHAVFRGVGVLGRTGVPFYRVRLSVGGKERRFGCYAVDKTAALVYDHLVTRMHELYGYRKRPKNLPKECLAPGSLEMIDADRWLEGVILPVFGAGIQEDVGMLGVKRLLRAHDRFEIQVLIKGDVYCFGDYDDVCLAGLAYDYAVLWLHDVHGADLPERNSTQYSLESDVEKSRISAWLERVYEEASCPMHGLFREDGLYAVRVRSPAGHRVYVGRYESRKLACLVHDYACRVLSVQQPLNLPSQNMDEYEDERLLLDERLSQIVQEEDWEEARYNHALVKLREAVSHGPEYVCCACNQLWFRRSVFRLTTAFLEKVSTGRTSGVLSSESNWICETCHRYLSSGKVPPCSKSRFRGFEQLPTELQGLSNLEADLIALRLPFMKVRGLGVSAKNMSARKKSNPFGQLCLSGMVVNVPTNLAQIQIELPRSFSPDDTILVNLKRRLQYSGVYESDNVRL